MNTDHMSSIAEPAPLYVSTRRIRHIDTEDFRLTEIELAPGQYIPWHRHSHISDTFYVLRGTLDIAILDPEQRVRVGASESLTFSGKRPHRVQNTEAYPVVFLLLQGIGVCDFIGLQVTEGAKSESGQRVQPAKPV